MPDIVIPLSLKSLTHVHSQLVSKECAYAVNMHVISWCDWLAGLPFMFATSSPLKIWSHLATMRYGRVCSPKAFCNPLWHHGAVHLYADWILMKQHCSYLTEYVFRAPYRDTLWLTPPKDKQIHANRMTCASSHPLYPACTYTQDHKKHCSDLCMCKIKKINK